jgi:hypothetical protein
MIRSFKAGDVNDPARLRLWELPDVILINVVRFVAASTQRTRVLCHQIAPLCKAASKTLLEGERSSSLWEMVLKEDYGVDLAENTSTRRACKRLRRSPVHRVRDAHLLIKDNTEISFFFLSEMVCRSSPRGDLTRSKLCRLLDEYGPHLRVNNVVSSGGLYLVEVCRARLVKESTILMCVKELVEQRQALLDLQTAESPQSCQTALCVAAARGMSTIVKYLLQQGADRNVRSSGRFRLHTQPKKTLSCRNVTAMEFSMAMLDAEKDAGATGRSLAGLHKCIRLLREPLTTRVAEKL